YVFMYKIFNVASHWIGFTLKMMYTTIIKDFMSVYLIFPILLIILLRKRFNNIFSLISISRIAKTIVLVTIFFAFTLVLILKLGTLSKTVILQKEYVNSNYSSFLFFVISRIPDILLFFCGTVITLKVILEKIYIKKNINTFLILLLLIFLSITFLSVLASSSSFLSNIYLRLFPYVLILFAIVISDNIFGYFKNLLKNNAFRSIFIILLMTLSIITISKSINEPFLTKRYLFYLPEEVLGLRRLLINLTTNTQGICSSSWCSNMYYRFLNAFYYDLPLDKLVEINSRFIVNGTFLPLSLIEVKRQGIPMDKFNEFNRVYDNGLLFILENNQGINLQNYLHNN
ncbi:MAG: hypothetical protein ACTSQG_11270, partial [Promethearchaeota archaeon]